MIVNIRPLPVEFERVAFINGAEDRSVVALSGSIGGDIAVPFCEITFEMDSAIGILPVEEAALSGDRLGVQRRVFEIDVVKIDDADLAGRDCHGKLVPVLLDRLIETDFIHLCSFGSGDCDFRRVFGINFFFRAIGILVNAAMVEKDQFPLFAGHLVEEEMYVF